MDRDEWIAEARQSNGGLVAWIDQGTDAGLQQANSRGVCFALTRGWVQAYTSYRVERAAFVNAFRTGGATRIPAEYLRLQAAYGAEVRANRVRFEAALADLRARIARGEDVDVAALRQAMLTARQAYYGRACIALDTYATEIDGTADVFRAPIAPRYCMVTMRGARHVVGFELRPDLVTDELPNGLYELFDANLGLFYFRAVDDLEEFWAGVQAALYQVPGTVEVATFGIGRGGFAKTWGELLTDLRQWVGAQVAAWTQGTAGAGAGGVA